MKKLPLLTIVLVCGMAVAGAESPQSPTARPPAPMAALKLPASTQAAFVAGQLIQQVNAVLNQTLQAIENGIPPQNGNPEFTAKDLQAAIGPETLVLLRSMAAIAADAQAASPQPPAPAPVAAATATATATPTPTATPEEH